MIEIGLTVPLLLLILTGIFAFGMMLNQYELLTNAVSDGARAFALSEGISGQKSMAPSNDPCAYAVTAIEAAAPSLTASNMTFTMVYTSSGTATTYTTTCSGLLMNTGDTVQIKVVYPVTPFVVGWVKRTVNLTAQTTELVQ